MNAGNVDWSVYVITDRYIAGDRWILDVVRAVMRGERGATPRENGYDVGDGRNDAIEGFVGD